MDAFTDKANSVIKQLLKEKVIYDSTKESQEEDDQQTQQPTSDEAAMRLDQKTIGAINMAKKLSTSAKGGMFFNRDPQKKMDQAYGAMLGKISKRISDISNKI